MSLLVCSWAVVGEIDKIVPLSPRRIAMLSVGDELSLRISLIGAAAENVTM